MIHEERFMDCDRCHRKARLERDLVRPPTWARLEILVPCAPAALGRLVVVDLCPGCFHDLKAARPEGPFGVGLGEILKHRGIV